MGLLVGRVCLTCCYCLSLSQNKFARISSLLLNRREATTDSTSNPIIGIRP